MKTAAKSRKTNREQARVPALVPAEAIVQHIIFLRGCKVLLDADLAVLYGVPTKVLLQAVKRNLERFPADFMFQLSAAEFAAMRSQFVTSNEVTNCDLKRR